jgi:thiosulfate/3-mercaptopyruvate sulfurtransferase
MLRSEPLGALRLNSRTTRTTMHRTLISTDTLASERDESWVVVDCRYNLRDEAWGHVQYREGHIPGSVYANLSKDLSAPRSGTNGRHPLPCVEAIETTFGRLGISNNTQVIAYDQDTGMYASRLWWMLRYLGHESAAVLDGGWAKWIREARAVRAGDEGRPAATFSGHRHKELRVITDDVAKALGDPSVLLVDARAPERFEGRDEPVDHLPGRIPGAVNHFYKRNLTDQGVMLPVAALREQFKRLLDGRRPNQVVMYCGSGLTACQNLLAMEHAGLRGAALYAGSWSEWAADQGRPVERGPVRQRKA